MTKLLAIETIGIRGSVACAENSTVLAEDSLSPDQRSAQSLVPAIDALLRRQNWSPSEIDSVAVAVGPGSFTGLRVGVTTAKVLSWSCKAEIYGVDSLLAAAFQTAALLPDLISEKANESPQFASCREHGAAIVSFALDAQRGDVSVRNFLIKNDSAVPFFLDDRSSLIPLTEWFSSPILSMIQQERISRIVPDFEKLPVFYAGPVLLSRRISSLNLDLPFLPSSCGVPTAKGVALAALSASKPDDPFTLIPVYSRESAAEEKRKQAK